MAQLKKQDLIKILVEEYGYEKEDLKFDAEGKPYTNSKLQQLIDTEKADAEELETSKYRVVAKKSNIKDDELITVMSGSMGTVIYRSEVSGKKWQFERFGQMQTIPYMELVTIQNRYSGYFADGWIVVLDERVQKEFNLTHMYKNILTPQNIDGVFQKSAEELEVLINNLPEGMKNTFINKAQELFENDKLDNYRVIKLIEQKFGFKLEDNAPVEDIAIKSDLGRDNIIYVEKAR